jgi:hypothetical protein
MLRTTSVESVGGGTTTPPSSGLQAVKVKAATANIAAKNFVIFIALENLKVNK